MKNRVKSSGRKSASKRDETKPSSDEVMSVEGNLNLNEAVTVGTESSRLVKSFTTVTIVGEEVNKGNAWSTISPDKVGRSKTPQVQKDTRVQISACFKFGSRGR